MNILIRLEEEKDYRDTEYMTREAFWDLYKPGCDEHLVLHKLRKVTAFVKELDFVACFGSKIAGNIVYSKAKVVNAENNEHEVLCMGPITVLPSCQGKGIGTMLMDCSIQKAKKLGFRAIIIFGNPEYYHRFGFVNAERFGIKTSWGDNFEEFMALELYDGSLSGISGKFCEDPAFQTEEHELEIFEQGFPYREKHVTDTQLKMI